MVNAYIDDSETDQVLVNEYTGTVLRWSHKGAIIPLLATMLYAFCVK